MFLGLNTALLSRRPQFTLPQHPMCIPITLYSPFSLNKNNDPLSPPVVTFL